MRLGEGLDLTGEPLAPQGGYSASTGPAKSPKTLANEVVSILTVARSIGVETPDFYSGGTAKIYCPFSDLWHSDGGYEQAARIYIDSNSMWCFACSRLYTPTLLYALTHDVTEQEAARILLDEAGYRSLDLVEKWDQIISHEDPIDKYALIESLKLFCNRIADDWETDQFTPAISKVFLRCLELVDKIQTADDARLWLETTKRVMKSTLNEKEELRNNGD